MVIEESPPQCKNWSEIDKSDPDPMMLYLIINKEVKMSPGKLSSQIAHGMKLFMLKYFECLNQSKEDLTYLSSFQKATSTSIWLKDSNIIITLGANKSQWNRIKEEIDCFVVKDAGLTEVEAGTETVLVLWPQKKSKFPKFFKRLRKFQ